MNEGLCNMAQMGKRNNILATGPNYKKKGAGALKPLCMSFGVCAVSRPESKDNLLDSQVFLNSAWFGCLVALGTALDFAGWLCLITVTPVPDAFLQV